MKKRIAINGFGRIGRILFRELIKERNIEIVAINASVIPEEIAYLIKYDSIHGEFPGIVKAKDGLIVCNNKKITLVDERDASKLPWKKLKIDCVLECTGAYTKLDDAMSHIKAGAKSVIISAPGKGDMKTIVYGVNEKTLTGKEKVISASSCTTNCLAPVLKVIDDNFGIEQGFMTTIHAFTNDQSSLDVHYKKDYMTRRGRACGLNIIPTTTGAATSIGNVLPNLVGKMSGNAVRVPVADGSMIDLSLILSRNTTKEEINKVFKKNQSEVLAYTEDPVVSSDVIHKDSGALFDSLLTEVLETNGHQLVKVVAWYDNEYGYSMQMIRTMKYFLSLKKK